MRNYSSQSFQHLKEQGQDQRQCHKQNPQVGNNSSGNMFGIGGDFSAWIKGIVLHFLPLGCHFLFAFSPFSQSPFQVCSRLFLFNTIRITRPFLNLLVRALVTASDPFTGQSPVVSSAWYLLLLLPNMLIKPSPRTG
jgi:hypothetical protein